MRFIFILVSYAFMSILCAKGQGHKIKAVVYDNLSNHLLPSVSVTILTSKDSILYKSMVSDGTGKIEFTNIEKGDYLVMLGKKGYDDYYRRLTINIQSPEQLDLGILYMSPKVKVLEEVVINAKKRGDMSMKGDTLVFRAESFKVLPNAPIEDLLKKLPTIRLDKNGNITAEGESVKKVLVDGEEFFGNDPTLVTRNLRADMVNTIEVYDKQTKQALLTGIAQGNGEKVLNVKLKEDKNKGYFGKGEIGGSSQKLYELQVMFNKFREKEKISAFSIASNNGLTGLGIDDESRYGDENNSQNNDLNTWNGRYNGQGLPTIQTGGLHYNNKWNKDQYSVNINYKFSNLNVDGYNNLTTQFFLPQNVNTIFSNKNYKNDNLTNKANLNLEVPLNQSTLLSLTTNISIEDQRSFSQFTVQNFNETEGLLNKNKREISSDGKEKNINNLLLLNKKFGTGGANLLMSLEQRHYKSKTVGNIISHSDFYHGTNNRDSSSNIDQFKNNSGLTNFLSPKLIFSVPLTKASMFYTKYSFEYKGQNINLQSFNKEGQFYTELDNNLSNSFKSEQENNFGGIGFNFNKDKFSMQVEQNIGFINIKNTDLTKSHLISNRNYTYWIPSLNLKYTFNTGERLSLNYRSETNAPTITQLQPLINNNDPLNLYLGNPKLDPEFRHNFNLLFRKFNPLKEETFLINASYDIINHSIAMNIDTDTSGKSIYVFENINSRSRTNLNTYFIYGRKISGFLSRISVNGGITTSRYLNYTNTLLSENISSTYTIGFGITKSSPDKYEFSLTNNYSFNKNNIKTLQDQLSNFFTINTLAEMDLYLPRKFMFHTEGVYNFQDKNSAFQKNFQQLILNLWISKRFLKEEKLTVKVIVNDLFNQNSGFIRTSQNNALTQSEFNTIKRNVMLTATYNFSKF